jgi:hypothetical protein
MNERHTQQSDKMKRLDGEHHQQTAKKYGEAYTLRTV